MMETKGIWMKGGLQDDATRGLMQHQTTYILPKDFNSYQSTVMLNENPIPVRRVEYSGFPLLLK